MPKYYVDFQGYCSIEANSADEAERKFWAGEGFDHVVEIDGIEMASVFDEE